VAHPDKIIVNFNKITIISKQQFKIISKYLFILDIENILNIRTNMFISFGYRIKGEIAHFKVSTRFESSFK
jgi:hypothetical protein